jgi:ATP-dependent RNA helicase DDX21
LRRKDPERPWQLIHISRATSIIQRSLINLKACIVTMILRSSNDMPSISYAWQELKEQLTESIDDKLNGMALLKGKPGVGFDVCAEAVTEIQEEWHDLRCWQLTMATEQPEQEGALEGYGGSRRQRDASCGSFRGEQSGSSHVQGQGQ